MNLDWLTFDGAVDGAVSGQHHMRAKMLDWKYMYPVIVLGEKR